MNISKPKQVNHSQYDIKITPYTKSLNKSINLIYIAPTPVFSHGPEICYVFNRKCSTGKKEDLLRRKRIFEILKKVEEEMSNFYIYDSYHELCPESKCKIYDKKNDIIYFFDSNHLSVQKSKMLVSHFEKWFIKNF